MKQALESQYVPRNDTIHRSRMQYRKSCWDILEIENTNNLICTPAENFIFNFRIYKAFSYFLNFANLVPPNIYFLLCLSHTKHF